MDVNKKSLENDIVEAVTDRLSSSYPLSEKAKRRIAKSGSKLAERLLEIFEKQERKAAKKADEAKENTEIAKTMDKAEEDIDD